MELGKWFKHDKQHFIDELAACWDRNAPGVRAEIESVLGDRIRVLSERRASEAARRAEERQAPEQRPARERSAEVEETLDYSIDEIVYDPDMAAYQEVVDVVRRECAQ